MRVRRLHTAHGGAGRYRSLALRFDRISMIVLRGYPMRAALQAIMRIA
jgi:hypothetical protein